MQLHTNQLTEQQKFHPTSTNDKLVLLQNFIKASVIDYRILCFCYDLA